MDEGPPPKIAFLKETINTNIVKKHPVGVIRFTKPRLEPRLWTIAKAVIAGGHKERPHHLIEETWRAFIFCRDFEPSWNFTLAAVVAYKGRGFEFRRELVANALTCSDHHRPSPHL
jgi:hypothetical protein